MDDVEEDEVDINSAVDMHMGCMAIRSIVAFVTILCRRFEQAMVAIENNGGRYSMVSVARLYVDHLLAEQRFEEAAQLCSRTFGSDTALWEEEVYKFVKIQQLR